MHGQTVLPPTEMPFRPAQRPAGPHCARSKPIDSRIVTDRPECTAFSTITLTDILYLAHAMKEGKPATIKEIAKRLKISPSTVSRALNDHPSIGLVTTMRVKKIAAELNYEPNQTAIFFKQRKTFTIGVVLPNISEPFFSAAISEIENVASEK